MELTKEQIHELMTERGYSATAHNGDNTVFFFIKTKNNICLHATVNINNQSLVLDSPGNLRLGFFLTSGSLAIDHPRFKEFEDALYRYAYICSVDDKKEKDEPSPIPVEERKKAFWDEIRAVCKEKGYTKELALEFYNYWTETNTGGKKFRKEMEKVFDIPGRLRTWIRHDKKWSKTFIDKKIEKQEKELTEEKKIVSKKELFG